MALFLVALAVTGGMHSFLDSISTLLGLGVEPKNLTFVEICLRGGIVFVAALVMLRLGDRRALAQKTAFDIVLLVLLASVLPAPSTAPQLFSQRWEPVSYS